MLEKIEASVCSLLEYIESESYRGFDPYDALTSGIFNNKFLNNKWLHFAVQQFVKRSPLNLRKVLLINKGYNPVTLGLCIQCYSNLINCNPSLKSHYVSSINFLINELKRMIPDGYSGACWGYDFPWQAKHATIRAFQPTVVATGIITNSLYIAYKNVGLPEAFELCESASHFVLKNLNRTYDADGTFCFSYSPFDNQEVYNASAKGVRLLSQVYSETRNEELRLSATKAVSYIIKRQNSDGSWNYSKSGKWIDNYHSGYVLDCLDEYVKCVNDTSIVKEIKLGFHFYINHFITKEGIPRLKHTNTYPVDCTAAGQTLLTLVRFKEIEKALKVADWMIDNMQSNMGYFYYRKNELFTNKISFMRWSNAWMIAGLSSLISNINYKYE